MLIFSPMLSRNLFWTDSDTFCHIFPLDRRKGPHRLPGEGLFLAPLSAALCALALAAAFCAAPLAAALAAAPLFHVFTSLLCPTNWASVFIVPRGTISRKIFVYCVAVLCGCFGSLLCNVPKWFSTWNIFSVLCYAPLTGHLLSLCPGFCQRRRCFRLQGLGVNHQLIHRIILSALLPFVQPGKLSFHQDGAVYSVNVVCQCCFLLLVHSFTPM